MLFDISSDFTNLVLPNLTTFESTNSSSTLSLSSLLDFFERSPLLERLHLDHHSHHDDDAVTLERVVSLHHMKCVYISGDPLTPADTSCGFLAHLSFPPGVVVDLSIYIRGSDFDDVARIIQRREGFETTELVLLDVQVYPFSFNRRSAQVKRQFANTESCDERTSTGVCQASPITTRFRYWKRKCLSAKDPRRR